MRNTIIAISIAFSSLCAGAALPKSLLPTEEEQRAMLTEADDFIDEMEFGIQDRQADAVFHALHGQTGELQSWRMKRNQSLKISAAVDTLSITGDGASRGMKMRLYRPKEKEGRSLPLLVYFHGGGWCIGGLDSCGAFCDALAATGSVMVLAVDYSLAPEKPYPAGFTDCVAALEYAFAHVEEWGGSVRNVSLGGDSSGGNLALATAIFWQEQAKKDPGAGQPGIKSLALYYPVVKAYSDKTSSWKKYGRGYGLDKRLMEAFNEAYLAGGDGHDMMVSPADATDEVLGQLPPVMLISATRDILYDQGKAFALRLKNVEQVDFAGAVHLFMTVPGQATAFGKAVALTKEWLD